LTVPKKKILGMPKAVFWPVMIVILAMLVVGFLSGPIGVALFGDLGFPDWMKITTPKPELPSAEIFSIGPVAITNTILTAWVTILVLVGLSIAATRKMKLIPGRLQGALEMVLSWIYNMCVDAAGEKFGRKFFPLVATIFLFIIVNAWMNLLPGYNTIFIELGNGHEAHLLRGANTDINLPLALAAITFVMVEYWGIKTLGGFHYLSKFFNFKPLINAFRHKEGVIGIFNGFITIFVGLLEFFLEFVRIISLTFRLFGNMIGGEILILMITFLAPFIIGIPFYGLEMLVGFVQALVFCNLALVFSLIAVTPHGEENH